MARIKIRLADASARLPDPTRDFALVPAGVDHEVDDAHPFWISALADGSVVPAPAAPAPVKTANKPDPKE